jgi:predicted Zn finger-like uncharacterized protein
MRIECDKCAAKYSIADEKVKGKTFKIRCKKCSNVIIVRDKVAGDDGDAAEEPASSDDGGGWHVAIDGDTVGPLSEEEVRRRYDAGQIDKSTSVWREGFEDWLELGQIEAFADLPDHAARGGGGMAAGGGLAAAAAADDPFASSGSDDAFAAGSSGEFGRSSGGGYAASAAAPAAAASRPQAASAPAESPRVGASSLTGQRNENSVLFSLDSLKAMASAPAASGRPSTAGPVRSAPSTTAPASEGSGLIDIRAMGAMMDVGSGGGAGPSGASEDELLPSFGGGALGGLSVEPLAVEPPPSAVPVAPEQRRSNAPMYILIALLTAGLIGLGVMVFLQEDEPPQVIKEVVTVPGSVEDKESGKAGDKEDDGEDKGDEKGDEKGDDKEAAGDTGGETEGDATDPTGAVAKKKKKVGGTSGGTTGGSTGGTTTGGTTGGTTAKPPEKDPDVDCLLDPNLPKCKGGGGSGGDTKAPVDSSLPPKLGAAEISAGIDGVKAEAKKCGAGTTVPIKFSVKGSTGAVTSATPLEEHASTPIGKCVASAAKAAKFPKFQAEQQGFTFKFRL